MNQSLRLFSFITALLILSLSAQAFRPLPVQPLEGEFRIGPSVPLGSYNNGDRQLSVAIGVEGRYNFSGTPFDCGLAFDFSDASRNFYFFGDDRDSRQRNRTFAIEAVGHYNLNQGGRCNPFAGVGLGAAYNDVGGSHFYPHHGWAPIITPQLGVEFVNHIRLSAQFNICRVGFNTFTFTFGAVIGGRPSRNTNK